MKKIIYLLLTLLPASTIAFRKHYPNNTIALPLFQRSTPEPQQTPPPPKQQYEPIEKSQFHRVFTRDIEPFITTLGNAGDETARALQQYLCKLAPAPAQVKATAPTRASGPVRDSDEDEGFFTMVRNAANEVNTVAHSAVSGAYNLFNRAAQTIEQVQQNVPYAINKQLWGTGHTSMIQAVAVRQNDIVHQIWIIGKSRTQHVPSSVFRNETTLFVRRQGPKPIKTYSMLLDTKFWQTPKNKLCWAADKAWCYTNLTPQAPAAQELIKDLGIKGETICVYAWGKATGDATNRWPAVNPDGYIVTCMQKMGAATA